MQRLTELRRVAQCGLLFAGLAASSFIATFWASAVEAQQTTFFQRAFYGYSPYLGASTFVIGDVNGDGKPDLYAPGNGYYCGGAVGVALGKGDGTFQAPICFDSGSTGVLAVAIADMNGDGKPDLIAMGPCDAANNCATGIVAVLLGNGDGTFQPAISNTSGIAGAAMSTLVVGDVNGDGRLDVVGVTGANGGAVLVLLGNGDGTLQAAQGYNPPYAYVGAGQTMAGGFITASVLADINGDGLLDVVLVSSCASNVDCANGAVGFLLGLGNGAFQSSSSAAPLTQNAYLTPYGANAVMVADLNGDAVPDIAVASNGASGQDGVASVLLGAGFQRGATPAFLPIVNYDSGGQRAYAVSAVDVNRDGAPDLIVLSQSCPASLSCNGSTVGVLLGNGYGAFQAAQINTSAPAGGTVMVVTDVNGDGVPDAMVNQPQFSVLLGVGPADATPTDGPIPPWAVGALGLGLVGIATRRLRRAA